MKIDELKPKPIERVQFKLVDYKSVPKVAGCYILTTFDNYILYIGLSINLYERFKQHLANPEKTKPTIDGKAIWFYFTTYDKKNLPQLERTWLNQYNLVHSKRPILNKVDSPIS